MLPPSRLMLRPGWPASPCPVHTRNPCQAQPRIPRQILASSFLIAVEDYFIYEYELNHDSSVVRSPLHCTRLQHSADTPMQQRRGCGGPPEPDTHGF